MSDRLIDYCRSLAGATEDIKWGDDRVFSVAGRMFCVFPVEPNRRAMLSFKVEQDSFLALTDRPGIIPAPYLARARWVAVLDESALPAEELESLVRRSYELVVAKLPKKARLSLG